MISGIIGFFLLGLVFWYCVLLILKNNWTGPERGGAEGELSPVGELDREIGFRRHCFYRVLTSLKCVAEKIEATPEQQERYEKQKETIKRPLAIVWLYLRALIKIIREKL